MDTINRTRQEYIKRVNLVLQFIENNLDSQLSLKTLSHIAMFSPFHFHRIFSTMTGETLNDYIIRKRIERIASILLEGTKVKLTDLAFKYGFNSPNTLSKTFKKFYGVTPTEFSKKRPETFSKIGIELVTTEKYFCIVNNIKKWMDMNANVALRVLPEMKLAGITSFGDFENTGKNYLKLFKWANEHELIEGKEVKVVTTYYDNPHVSGTERARHAECITVDKDITAFEDIGPVINTGGKYIVGRFEIPPGHESFENAWNGMHTWVIENNYKYRDGSYMEVFHNDCRDHPEKKFIVDICIPVE